MFANKVKINGKKYVVHKQEERWYDSYYYKGSLYNVLPINARIIGYIVEDKSKIAYCKRDYTKLLPGLYVMLGICGASILVATFVLINGDIDVPQWTAAEAIRNVKIELDSGVRKPTKRITYSQYATYNGECVELYVNVKKKNTEVAIKCDGVVTDYIPAEDAYKIPMALNMKEQEMKEALLCVKTDDTVSEYPLYIEYPVVDNPQLPMGEQHEVAEEEEPIEVGDFANYEVVVYKRRKEVGSDE